MLQFISSKAAHAEVAATDKSIPRIVFDAPNSGRPSMNPVPPSNGKEKSLPRMSRAITGVPFATVSRNSSRAMISGCTVALYLKSRAVALLALGVLR